MPLVGGCQDLFHTGEGANGKVGRSVRKVLTAPRFGWLTAILSLGLVLLGLLFECFFDELLKPTHASVSQKPAVDEGRWRTSNPHPVALR